MTPIPTIYVQIAWYVWAIIGIIWLIGYFGNKKTIKRPNPGRYLFSTLLLILAYVLFFNPSILGYALTPTNAAFGIIGDIFILAGAVFAIWARVILGRNWSGSMATLKEDHKLVQAGPYKYVRHPIYTGLFFMMLGTALTVGAVGGYIAVLLGLIAFLIRIPTEEELMTSQFPDQYPVYRDTVKGLIPFIW